MLNHVFYKKVLVSSASLSTDDQVNLPTLSISTPYHQYVH